MHTDSPAVVEHLLAISAPEEVHIQWSANEKVAFETALGAPGRAAGTGLHERLDLSCLKLVTPTLDI